MENITIELYIIAYTFIGVILLYMYSLPLRIIGRAYKWIKNLFTNNNKWGFY